MEKVFVSVNGSRIKSAADRLIDGTWNEVTCLACGITYGLESPLLFTDVPGHVWIAQHELSDRDRFAILETEADAIFSREFLERPPAAIREQASSVRRRVCFGRRQLAEKLLARREGIDDRALECLKLALMRDCIRELYPYGPTEFCLREIEGTSLKLIATNIAEQRPVFEVVVPRQTLLNEKELAPFMPNFPELFTNLYVNASRYWTGGSDQPFLEHSEALSCRSAISRC